MLCGRRTSPTSRPSGSSYHETGFLYTQKLEAMGDAGRQALATLRDLIRLDTDDYRVSICCHNSGQIVAACTYARFSPTTAWIMHLASAHDRQALGLALERSCRDYLAAHVDGVAYTFRESNRSVRRLLNRGADPWKNHISQAVLAYYRVRAEESQRFSQAHTDIRVRRATEDDWPQMVQSAIARGDPAVGTAGLCDRELHFHASLDASRDHRLWRHRATFTAVIAGTPAGIAQVDVAPEWWNLSNLGTGVRLYLCQQDPQVVVALMAAAATWLSERSARQWTLLA